MKNFVNENITNNIIACINDHKTHTNLMKTNKTLYKICNIYYCKWLREAPISYYNSCPNFIVELNRLNCRINKDGKYIFNK